MSYSTHRPGRERRSALGGVDVGALAGLTSSILNNPYVPEILCRARQLEAANTGKPVAACLSTPMVPDTLGLGKFMLPVRGYVYAEQHKWAYAVGAVVAVGVPFLIGYLVGKNR